MSVEELATLREDTNKAMTLVKQRVGDMRTLIQQCSHYINKHETRGTLEVCDHAIVRYLERVKGLDIPAIRAEIADNVKSAHGDVEVKGDATGVLCGNYVYVLQAKKGRKVKVVSTVYEARDYQKQDDPDAC